VGDEQPHAREKLAGYGADAETEEILYLGGGDEDGNAVGESDQDSARNKSHGRAESGEGHADED
jgi:hypothetical protein